MGLFSVKFAFTGIVIVVNGGLVYQFEIARLSLYISHRHYQDVGFVSALVSFHINF